MKDSQKTTSNQSDEGETKKQALNKSLHPSQVNWNKISSDEEKKQVDDIIDEWLKNLQKEVSDLLEKHGATTYQLTILHEGTKKPMLMARGSIYEAAKLAVSATRQLRGQIAEELSTE